MKFSEKLILAMWIVNSKINEKYIFASQTNQCHGQMTIYSV